MWIYFIFIYKQIHEIRFEVSAYPKLFKFNLNLNDTNWVMQYLKFFKCEAMLYSNDATLGKMFRNMG